MNYCCSFRFGYLHCEKPATNIIKKTAKQRTSLTKILYIMTTNEPTLLEARQKNNSLRGKVNITTAMRKSSALRQPRNLNGIQLKMRRQVKENIDISGA